MSYINERKRKDTIILKSIIKGKHNRKKYNMKIRYTNSKKEKIAYTIMK